MGGARPKCTVERNDALWIAKFSAKNDTVNIPRIEYATMTLAGLCGIQVPPIEMVTSCGSDSSAAIEASEPSARVEPAFRAAIFSIAGESSQRSNQRGVRRKNENFCWSDE